MKKAYFNWSTGKDSALALYLILRQHKFSVKKLVTTVNADFKRVSMHGVPEKLLEKQSESIGIPLQKIYIPKKVSMHKYNKIMEEKMLNLTSEGYKYSIFGDIFLDDLKQYKENKLAVVNLKAIFPLWKVNTNEIIQKFISLGLKLLRLV